MEASLRLFFSKGKDRVHGRGIEALCEHSQGQAIIRHSSDSTLSQENFFLPILYFCVSVSVISIRVVGFFFFFFSLHLTGFQAKYTLGRPQRQEYRNLTWVVWYSVLAFLSVASSHHTILRQKRFHFLLSRLKHILFCDASSEMYFPTLISKSNNNTNASAEFY